MKENRGRKNWPAVVAVLAVFALIGSAFVYTRFRKEDGTAMLETLKEETVRSETSQIYHPGYEALAYDESSCTLYYDNMLIVYLLEELSQEEQQLLAGTVDGEVAGFINGALKVLQIRVPETDLAGLQKQAETLMQEEKVLYATFDLPMEVESHSAGSKQTKILKKKAWWADAIDAWSAWEKEDQYASPVKVAVIDNGFSLDHEDLKGKITMLTPNLPESDHGTHVAGLIAATNNDKGIRGVADQAEILGIDWSQGENNNLITSECEFLAYLSEAIEKGAKVVNMSFGQHALTRTGLYNGDLWKIWKDYRAGADSNYTKYLNALAGYSRYTAKNCVIAMAALYFNGYEDYLLVQSAGNGIDNGGRGVDALVNGYFAGVTSTVYENVLSELSKEKKEKLKAAGGYPFFSQRILIVGSVKNKKNKNGYYKMADFSNYGGQIDICAPGEKIYSTVLKNSYGKESGTSMAAPLVSGAAALVWSINPSLTAPEVRSILVECTTTKAIDTDSSETLNTYPMLNVGKATERAVELLDAQAEAGVDYESYLKNTLIPEYGLMSDEYQKFNLTKTGVDVSKIDGILSYRIEDFDLDGREELLILRYEYLGGEKNRLYLQFYDYSAVTGIYPADCVYFYTEGFGSRSRDLRSAVFFTKEKNTGQPVIYLYASQSTVTVPHKNYETIRQFRFQNGYLQETDSRQLTSWEKERILYYSGEDWSGEEGANGCELAAMPDTAAYTTWKREELGTSDMENYESREAHLLADYEEAFLDIGIRRNRDRFGIELTDETSSQKYLVRAVFRNPEELDWLAELDTRLEEIGTKAKDIYIRDYSGLHGEEKEPETQVKAQKTGTVAAAFEEYLGTVLVPQYGVMKTDEQKGNWTVQELNGLLSATIQDFDSDGQEELLTVGCFSTEGNGSGQIRTYLILHMYEYDSDVGVTESAECRLPTSGGFSPGAIGYRQLSVFTYKYESGTYLAVDSWLYANESIVTLAVFQYGGEGMSFVLVPHTTTGEKADETVYRDGTSFDFVAAMGYQAQGNGDRYVRFAFHPDPTADGPASPLCCYDWKQGEVGTSMDYSYTPEEDPALTPEQNQEFMEGYRSRVESVGLRVKDERIGMSENSGWPSESCNERLITAEEVYMAQEGEIHFLSGLYTDGKTGEKQLIRQDNDGSLHKFR